MFNKLSEKSCGEKKKPLKSFADELKISESAHSEVQVPNPFSNF